MHSVSRGEDRRQFANSSAMARLATLGLIAAQATAEIALKGVPSRSVRAVGAQMARLYHHSPLPKKDAHSLTQQALRAAALNPWPIECVAESIVLWSLLCAHGHPAYLRLGMRTILGHPEAHLWVELHGKTLNDVHGDAETWQAFEKPWAVPAI